MKKREGEFSSLSFFMFASAKNIREPLNHGSGNLAARYAAMRAIKAQITA
jgi:hypothetical protein